MCDTKHCSNCGIKSHHAKGLCVTCYQYRQRTGRSRPVRRPLPPKPGRCKNCHLGGGTTLTHGLCKPCYGYREYHGFDRRLSWRYCHNCGVGKAGQRTGLCKACYKYKNRLGVDRPEYLWSGSYCHNCNQRKIYSFGLCRNCYEYQRSHGYPRPRHLWTKHCLQCGLPAASGVKLTKGECPACYSYRLRTGKPRDKQLRHSQAPLGWCECGKKAVTVTRVQVGALTETFPLCESCAQEIA